MRDLSLPAGFLYSLGRSRKNLCAVRKNSNDSTETREFPCFRLLLVALYAFDHLEIPLIIERTFHLKSTSSSEEDTSGPGNIRVVQEKIRAVLEIYD